MPRYTIPPNTGKVRIVMGLGGTYSVWNGKHGKDEFVIACRTRKLATKLAEKINKNQHNGEVVVD